MPNTFKRCQNTQTEDKAVANGIHKANGEIMWGLGTTLRTVQETVKKPSRGGVRVGLGKEGSCTNSSNLRMLI